MDKIIKYQKGILPNLLSGYYEQVELELKDESHRAIFNQLRKDFQNERKQGAVEELKKVLELIDEDFENDSWVKTSNYCIERIKELEGAKEK